MNTPPIVSPETAPHAESFPLFSTACGSFGLLFAASGYAYHPLGMLAGIGLPVTLLGFVLAFIFQMRLMTRPQANREHGTLPDKAMMAILTLLTAIFISGILVTSVCAVATQAQSMLDAYRGHPRNVESTLTSYTAIGTAAATAISLITFYARKELSWQPLVALIYWASFVPASIAALGIMGRGSAYTN